MLKASKLDEITAEAAAKLYELTRPAWSLPQLDAAPSAAGASANGFSDGHQRPGPLDAAAPSPPPADDGHAQHTMPPPPPPG